MTALRRLFLDRRALSALIVTCALMMRILVPSGFMLGHEGGSITMEICSGSGPMAMPGAIPGMDHRQDQPAHQGKDMPCAFSALAAPSLPGIDAALLAVALVFIVATVFRVATPLPARVPPRLRPPLRGPPLLA